MTYNHRMISFVETKLFTRLVQEYLSDDEYSELQQALLSDPEALGSPMGRMSFSVGFPGNASSFMRHLSATITANGLPRCARSTKRTYIDQHYCS